MIFIKSVALARRLGGLDSSRRLSTTSIKIDYTILIPPDSSVDATTISASSINTDTFVSNLNTAAKANGIADLGADPADVTTTFAAPEEIKAPDATPTTDAAPPMGAVSSIIMALMIALAGRQ